MNIHPIFQKMFLTLGWMTRCDYCNQIKPCMCIRTECAWCKKILKDIPVDKRGVSSGICDDCGKKFSEEIDKA